MHGTTFADIKIESLGNKDDKFLKTFSQVEHLDNDRLELVEERNIIVEFINDVYKSITNMNDIELKVFRCRYIDGLTNQETADRLSYTIDRIKQINRQIKEKM